MKILLLLTPIALFAAEILDFDMTPQEKKQTGIAKLSEKEKNALQTWIDNHYTKRSTPLQATAPTSRPQISENIRNGQAIRLTDGTLWTIRPQDTLLTQSWITPVDILVSQSGDPTYPYKLTNSLTGSSVLAKKS
jgi:hypothetical protein